MIINNNQKDFIQTIKDYSKNENMEENAFKSQKKNIREIFLQKKILTDFVEVYKKFMNEFQLPVVLVIIFSFIVSLSINKFLLNFKNLVPDKSKNQEIRLSSLKIPAYGGIAMSIAFLISSDYLVEQILMFSNSNIRCLITFIGFIDDLYNLNWKLKLFYNSLQSVPQYLS